MDSSPLTSLDMKLKHPSLVPTQKKNISEWSIHDDNYDPIKYTSKEVLQNSKSDIDLLIKLEIFTIIRIIFV